MTTGGPVLEREQHGAVQLLTLNRPDAANSLDPALLDALSSSFAEIEADDHTQVAVVTGAGDRIFCAGMDLKAFGSRPAGDHPTDDHPTDDHPTDDHRPVTGFDLFGHLCSKPVIAAVNGAAVGGGFELVLACDLVVAADHARFGLPEVKRGLLPAGGGTLLGTRIPLALALEIALTGDLVGVDRMASWGLVNRVVAAEDLLPAALELAATIAANGPLASRTIKRLMRRAVLEDPRLGWGTPEELAAVFGSDDAKEGARAFLEKRQPVWTTEAAPDLGASS